MDIIFLPHFKAIKRKPAAIPGASRNFKTINYKNEYCHTWPKKKINRNSFLQDNDSSIALEGKSQIHTRGNAEFLLIYFQIETIN